MPQPEVYKVEYTDNHKEVNSIYEPDAGSGEVKLTIDNRKTLTTVRFRNVGDKNPDAAIQFTVSEYNKGTNRTKHTSFSVPMGLVHLFIGHLENIPFEYCLPWK